MSRSPTIADRTAGWQSAAKAVFLSCFGAALLVFLGANLHYAVNMPYWDDYGAVLRFLTRLPPAHTLHQKLSLLLSLHNEHRIAIVRLLALLDLRLFGRVNFVFLNLVGELGLLGVIALLVFYTRRNGRDLWYLAAPAGILLLAFSQNELMADFASGAIQQYYQISLALVALYFAVEGETLAAVLASLCFATLAALSGAGGLIAFLLIAGFFLLRRRWSHALAASLSSAIIFALYFFVLPYRLTAEEAAGHGAALTHLGQLAAYILTFLGSAGGGAIIAMVVGAISLVWLAFLAPRRGKIWPRHAFLILAALFVLGNAVAAGWGRLSFGVSEAASSRYSCYSLLFFAILYLLTLLSSQERARQGLGAIALLASVLVFALWIHPGLGALEARKEELSCCLAHPDQTMATDLISRAAVLRIFTPIDSVRRNLPSALPLDRDHVRSHGYIGHLDQVAFDGSSLSVRGWAALPSRPYFPADVLLEVGRRIYPTIFRRAVTALGKKQLDFHASLGLPSPVSMITVRVVVAAAGRRAFYLSPVRTLHRRRRAR